MARFGTWAPLAANWSAQPKMTQVDIISLHTMVGTLAGTDAYFRRNGFGGTFSHFGVGGDGSCTQWQDTAYRAAANYNGNWHIISVECADIGPQFPTWNTADGSAVPAFTDAQCETLAHLLATIAPAHGIPLELIPDAKPGRRGIGYHRQGVPGYMVAGAEQWSTAVGKVCPGNRRIAQIPQIITRARQILAGDDMPLTQADADLVASTILNRALPRQGGPSGSTNLGVTLQWLDANLSGLLNAVRAQSAQVDAQALADAIVAKLPADDAAKVAELVVAALGQRLNTPAA